MKWAVALALCVGLSVAGSAAADLVAVNPTGNAHGDAVGVSGTGDASACSEPTEGLIWPCLAVSGTGAATACHGYYWLSIQGVPSRQCAAISGTGTASSNLVAVSALGDAATASPCIRFGPQDWDCNGGVAVSGLGNSQGSETAIVLSTVGDSNAPGGYAAVSLFGDANMVGGDPWSPSPGGYLASASLTGDASGGLVSISATGHASGENAISGCDLTGLCLDPL